jgi:hypothetical protein
VWSDDSRFLAVPQYFNRLGFFVRQRLLVIAFDERRVQASRMIAWYFQPETFTGGILTVSVNPFRSKQRIQLEVPRDFEREFTRLHVPWPELS